MGGLTTLRRLALGVAVAFTAVACGAQQGPTAQTDVGVTKDEIKIGATFPVSGPASAYYSVAKGANAYFQYINDKGGINGRKINFVVKDDVYLPANTPAKARELVQEEKVFLTYGDLGTPTNLAVRDYYNEQKVPQLFVFTGASFWGAEYDKYPWTLGWQPDYISEGKIYSKYIKDNLASSKIAILYQNDAYGLDYVNGLKKGLGDSIYSKMVVGTATYNQGDPTDMKSQVAKLKDSGADLFYVVCTPNYAASAVINAYNSGWKPKLIMNNVAGSVSTWRGVIKALGGNTAAVDGMISTAYVKDATDTQRYANDAGVKLFRDVMTKYGNGCPSDGTDAFCLTGMASAWSLVELLKSAGSTMTRKHVMDLACCTLNQTGNPLLLPGMVVKTTKTDHFPIQQMQLQKWTGQGWVLTGDLIDARGK